MAKRPKYEELKERVAALEKENQELRQSLMRTRVLIENLGNPMGVYDSEGVLLMMNKPGAADLNGAPDDFLGIRITDLIPENGHVYMERIKKTFRTGSATEYEDEVTLPSGKKWFLSIYQVAKDENGTPFGVQIVSVDITKGKNLEDRLPRREREIRIIADNVPALVAYVDRDGCYRFVNRRYEEWFGLAPTEIIGKHFTDVLGQICGEQIRCHVEKALSGKRVLFEEDLPYSRGGRRWVRGEYVPDIDDEARVKGFFALVTDLTERKQAEEALRVSEEQYRKLFEGALDGIAFADPDTGIILDCNDALLKLVERERDEVVGRSQKILHPPENALGDVTRTFEEHRTSRRGQVIATKLITKSGKLRDVEIKANFNEIGNRKVLQGIFRDITVRIKAEKEREEIRSQLYQAQKMETLGTLVAGVAHEINNPINLIMFNVPLLQKVWRDIQPILEKHALHEPHKKYGGLTSEFLKQDLDKLLRDMDLAANRVARIVSGLKDFAKMSDIRDKMPIQINEAVTNAMRLAQTTLKKAGIDVGLELGQDLPLIEGNLQGLEQIVLNLIVNASQAIEQENGRIRVKTGLDERKGQIVVVVSDNGKGIDPSTYGRIFDPFFTSRQAEGGTGLGLAVSYSLAKAHGGEITFYSEKGKGTTFTVTFPIA